MRRAMRGSENPYGVYFVGPHESYGLMAVSALAKWAFRHRSAFFPFIIALAAFIAAGMMHAHHAAWWPLITGITAAATTLLGFPHSVMRRKPHGRRAARILARLWGSCGIDRPEERAYAAIVTACAGGWISAATAIGQTAKPLPVTEAILTVVLGIPWWLHRRRRTKVRIESTVSAWPGIAEQIGLTGSRITSVTVDAWGWTARVILRKGTTTETAIQKIPAIESGLGTRPGSVRIFPDADKANALTMRVTENDPHASAQEWPGTTGDTITRPVNLGMSQDGWPVAVSLLRRNVLIGGTTGSGKSGIVNLVIAALAACKDVVLWGIDLKGGMELQPWESCLDRLATTPDEANDLFRDAVGELNRRAREKAAQGVRVLNPTANDPALVIIVDEYAELPDESHDCADSIARRGRAVAVNLIAATQRPTQTAMGKDTAVRSQMDVRICLRVRERRDADLILGQGSFNAGWQAHQFGKPGEFMVSDPEHSAPEKHRAYLITDERVARHAATCAAGRPAMPQTARSATQSTGTAPARTDDGNGPEIALWAALRAAGPEGVSVADLMTATGMTRPTLYRHLRARARAGRACQVARGYWRAADGPENRADGPDSEGR
ncbi:MAG TPA: FtsK/SpoIIIE domain-containing protein [Trebonia sp.]|jgi:S-DNA-T family DNA segregation ATPase FtsK/SpoIIIE